ncbi:PDX2-like protein [Mya arenaria]|uniref:glutaminase n=1 Tax=Mya arenaria TaxID=6604 RepID=A0ABY7E3C3_MYAAR|nr:pyridoxal 5'-phosphate synthase subunit PdxT-like [Mya arenaria]XP_052799918.1 pyridoxal 5'-phosphate synthase subunit PdxT-like [Mya arenaria]WAR03456.1 PDX2-like protein [Mya arenaria]
MPLAGTSHTDVSPVNVGILEVQGAFMEHKVSLQKAASSLDLEIHVHGIRTAGDITDSLEGLIIPGGESTTISIYLKRNNMEDVLRKWVLNERHVTWGTCAGMILLAKVTENQKLGGQTSLGVMDMDVSRNFFGRQLQSFEAPVSITDKHFSVVTGYDTFPGVFIRAPAIVKVLSSDVQVLATTRAPDAEDDVIVAAKQGNVITSAFHPELTEDCSWHMYFLQTIILKRT